MNYKQALAAVFAKYRNPRTRTHAVSLLERYASATRPVTAWHAVGEDADAARLLLETLGFRENTDFTVQTSVLDPSATRFSWTDAGLKLLAVMAPELVGMDLVSVQRRVLVPNDTRDPLEHVHDVVSAEDILDTESTGFLDRVLRATEAVARAVVEAAGAHPATAAAADVPTRRANAWAMHWLDPDVPQDRKLPVAPLVVLETLARLRGVQGLPGFPVFAPSCPVCPDPDDPNSRYWQGSRPMSPDGDMAVAGRVNIVPLYDQAGPCGMLDGFLAWNSAEWLKFRRRDSHSVVWTQFDAPLCRSHEALQFALDAERMRDFTCRILSSAYGPAFGAGLVGTTRLAVGNTALGGAPGNEDLSDDDGNTSSFEERVEQSPTPADAPVYMGAHLLAEDAAVRQPAWNGTATHPVRISTSEDSGDEAAADHGICTSELADEWFLVVHDGTDDAWTVEGATWKPAKDRRAKMESNLVAYRRVADVRLRNDADILALCSPDNPAFNRTGNEEEEGNFTVQGAFVNGVAAAMRRFEGGAMKFVQDSPYHPDKVFAGIWSGIATDLAPTSAGAAAEANVFPNMFGLDNTGGSFDFSAGYADNPDARMHADGFLKLMRTRPTVQTRFGKRTAGVPRSHVIVIETNVQAEPFVRSVASHDAGHTFRRALWRAFYTSFVTRQNNPLASVDESFTSHGCDSYRLSGFQDWVRNECPDWAGMVQISNFQKEPPTGFVARWMEDSKGRLLIVLASVSSNLSLRVKTAWRYAYALPVPSAAYLAKTGKAEGVVLNGLTDGDKYRKVLKAAMHESGFVTNCSNTVGSCGAFGTAWIKDAVWDMDPDECPGRDWYMVPGVSVDLAAIVEPRPF